ncbi:Uncharacterized protein ChrSV_1464 [Chromobacterium vaccinii]|nr:Uncharacterized protein ChrSW_1464 [Chromobacterium vaccinii]QND88922.1 Uncharacterized protein ChrSV_1464 [Chromobacterium vaccinii]
MRTIMVHTCARMRARAPRRGPTGWRAYCCVQRDTTIQAIP